MTVWPRLWCPCGAHAIRFALGPLLIGMPLLFGPIHIALLEMVIDPVCAFVFESEEDESDIMTLFPVRTNGTDLML